VERHDDVGEGSLGTDVHEGIGLAAVDLVDDLLRGVATFEHVALELPPSPEDLIGLEEHGDVDRVRPRPIAGAEVEASMAATLPHARVPFGHRHRGR